MLLDETLKDASLESVIEFVAEPDVLVVPDTLLLRLCVGLFDEDGDDDNDNVDVEVVHADVEWDNVSVELIVTIPEAEALVLTDN